MSEGECLHVVHVGGVVGDADVAVRVGALQVTLGKVSSNLTQSKGWGKLKNWDRKLNTSLFCH